MTEYSDEEKAASYERLCFDMDEMKRSLNGDDHIQLTMKAHLYVEHILMEFMKLALPRHDLVRMDRMNFSSKLEICAGTGALNPILVPPIKRLNIMRNDIAHNLHYSLTDSDKKKIFDSFDKFSRSLILENGTQGAIHDLSDVSFGHIFKVIIILLEISRQNYIEWQEQRAAAFKNAMDVLDKNAPVIAKLRASRAEH